MEQRGRGVASPSRIAQLKIMVDRVRNGAVEGLNASERDLLELTVCSSEQFAVAIASTNSETQRCDAPM
jgi:hypothetical protein